MKSHFESKLKRKLIQLELKINYWIHILSEITLIIKNEIRLDFRQIFERQVIIRVENNRKWNKTFFSPFCKTTKIFTGKFT